ncbi:hypothetical protein GF312_07805, partial [Candidatus Poribacteria bacterium]|nr:hypothetical protein [Candidatus Poribacteria bacterium]
MKKLMFFILFLCLFSSLSRAQIQMNILLSNDRFFENCGLIIPANLPSSDLTDHRANGSYDVLRHQEKAMKTLLGWSGASIIAGSAMLFHDSRVIRDFGIQNIAWGVIDAGIALYAKHSVSGKRDSNNISVQKEKQNFRRLLLINSLLDIVYVGIGTA